MEPNREVHKSDLGTSFVEAFCKDLRPGKLLFHISLLPTERTQSIGFPQRSEIIEFFREISRRTRQPGIIAYHPADPYSRSCKEEHIHWVHICTADTYGWCKCSFGQQWRGKWGLAFSTTRDEWSRQWVANLCSYLQREPRVILDAQIDGISRLDECIKNGIENNNTRNRNKLRDSGETCDSNVLSGEPPTQSVGGNYKRSNNDNGGARYRKRTGTKSETVLQKEEISLQLAELILVNMYGSKADIRTNMESRRLISPFIFDTQASNSIIEHAWEEATIGWNCKTMQEIIEHRWNQPNFKLDSRYYSPELSSLLILKLLIKQNGTGETTDIFISNIFAWIDKEISKKNTFTIIGPPSSGKTYFMDTVCDLLWNCGKMKNFSRIQQFPLDDCFNRRVLIWNEAAVAADSVNINKAKEILEGHDTVADRKYLPPGYVRRTPVAITSNNDLWAVCQSEAQAFQDRMFYYRWHRQDWLKKFQKKPHPLAWKYIYEWFNSTDYDNRIRLLNLIPDIRLNIDTNEAYVNHDVDIRCLIPNYEMTECIVNENYDDIIDYMIIKFN